MGEYVVEMKAKNTARSKEKQIMGAYIDSFVEICCRLTTSTTSSLTTSTTSPPIDATKNTPAEH